MGKVYIGTSGWMYSHWRALAVSSAESGNFYPENLPQKDWLRYYSTYFDTVEVNSSFYRQTRASTFEKWQSEVPAGFTFSIKGNRFITHIKRLKDVKEPIKIFFESAGVLVKSNKSQVTSKNVVLWQLPPSLGKDIGRLNSFLKLLSETGNFFRHAFEFRHPSWVDKETFTALLRSGVACTIVFQDWQDWPAITENTELYEKHREILEKLPFVYVRLHGKDMLYSSSYSDDDLESWAKKMQEWRKTKDVYAYFNNDALGYAVPNARTLKEML